MIQYGRMRKQLLHYVTDAAPAMLVMWIAAIVLARDLKTMLIVILAISLICMFVGVVDYFSE